MQPSGWCKCGHSSVDHGVAYPGVCKAPACKCRRYTGASSETAIPNPPAQPSPYPSEPTFERRMEVMREQDSYRFDRLDRLTVRVCLLQAAAQIGAATHQTASGIARHAVDCVDAAEALLAEIERRGE